MSDKEILKTDGELKLSTIELKPSTYYMQFNDINNNNMDIGKFYLNDDGKIDFEGDATESAKIFIEELKRMWNNG